MSEVIPSIPTVPAPPAAPVLAELSEQEPDQADRDDASLLTVVAGTTAISYYLSTFLHLLLYGVAALAYASVSQMWQAEEDVTPIRASLDDFDREAEHPQFEIVQEMNMGAASGESQIQQISNSLKAVDNGFVDTVDRELLPSMLSGDGDDGGDGDFLFRIPESGLAVTKGSFTVWTEPEHPTPRRPYRIIIEVQLKEGTRSYRPNDLSGYVIGSDTYRQKIPFDSQKPNNSFYSGENRTLEKLSPTKPIRIRDNKVQLVIQVPGADRLVKDTIQIRSRRLRERQELELVFGQQP